MTELVLHLVLGSHGSSITATNDDDLSALCCTDRCVECGFCSLGKSVELKDSRWAVPKDCLRLINGALESLDTLGAAVKSHPPIWDTLLICSRASSGILSKLVCSNIVGWENDFDFVLLGFLNKITNSLASSLVKQTVTNLYAIKRLL